MKNKENSDEQAFSPTEIESAKQTLIKMKKDIFKEIDAGIKEKNERRLYRPFKHSFFDGRRRNV